MDSPIKFNINDDIAFVSIDKDATRNALLPDDVFAKRNQLKLVEDDKDVRHSFSAERATFVVE